MVEAQRDFVSASAAEEEAALAERALEEAIEQEIAAAAQGDALVIGASLPGWLAQAKLRQADAATRRAAAQATTETAREAVREARIEENVIRNLIERRAAEARAKAERRAQEDLLEIILLKASAGAYESWEAEADDDIGLDIADDP